MPITVSDKAAREFGALVEREGKSGAALRLWVAGIGCSGFRYGMGIEDKELEQDDTSFESNGVKVVVDAQSLTYLEGSRIDFDDDEKTGGFSVDNPNPAPQSGCDCGEAGCGS